MTKKRIKRYGTILVRPPWSWDQSKTFFSDTQIQALPLYERSDEDSIILVHATAEFLDRAVDSLHHWGFAYSTTLPWLVLLEKLERVKRSTHAETHFWVIGQRGYTQVPINTIGTFTPLPNPDYPDPNEEMLYRLAEDRFPPPYLEVFAEQNRPGWDVWGDPHKVKDPIQLIARYGIDYWSEIEIQRGMAEIRETWQTHVRARWIIGDIINTLAKRFYPEVSYTTLCQMAAPQIPLDGRTTLSEYCRIAKMFPPSSRDYTKSYNSYKKEYQRVMNEMYGNWKTRRVRERSASDEVGKWIDERFGFVDKHSGTKP